MKAAKESLGSIQELLDLLLGTSSCVSRQKRLEVVIVLT